MGVRKMQLIFLSLSHAVVAEYLRLSGFALCGTCVHRLKLEFGSLTDPASCDTVPSPGKTDQTRLPDFSELEGRLSRVEPRPTRPDRCLGSAAVGQGRVGSDWGGAPAEAWSGRVGSGSDRVGVGRPGFPTLELGRGRVGSVSVGVGRAVWSGCTLPRRAGRSGRVGLGRSCELPAPDFVQPLVFPVSLKSLGVWSGVPRRRGRDDGLGLVWSGLGSQTRPDQATSIHAPRLLDRDSLVKCYRVIEIPGRLNKRSYRQFTRGFFTAVGQGVDESVVSCRVVSWLTTCDHCLSPFGPLPVWSGPWFGEARSAAGESVFQVEN